MHHHDKRNAAASQQRGSQTLARGLTALLAIVDSQAGLTIQDLAELLGVHRSIAFRLVQTLVDFGLVVRATDKSYRPGARLAVLANSYRFTLREIAQPLMQRLADEVGCTVSLFVAEGATAVAIATAEPTTAVQYIRFRPGMRTSIDRGAAGYALLATYPPSADDLEPVVRAREAGFAVSHGEVEPGTHGVAAGFTTPGVRACVNVMTYVERQAWDARRLVRSCASNIMKELQKQANEDA